MFSFNNTTVTNETESTSYPVGFSPGSLLVQFSDIYFIVGAITSFSTLFFGIISWIFLKKMRRFRNYVFLSVILNYTILYPLFFYQLSTDSYMYWTGKLIRFLVGSFSCWLFLSTIMIYRDIVKVFIHQITRQLLKYNIFGWGLPLIVTILSTVGDFTNTAFLIVIEQNYILLVFLLLINFILYIRVLCSLLRSPDIRSSPRRGSKFQAATFTFVMSGILLLLALFLSGEDAMIYGFIPRTLFISQTMVINMCFLLLKPNRILWKEFCNKVPMPTEV